MSAPSFDDLIALTQALRELEGRIENVKAELLPVVTERGGNVRYNGVVFRVGERVCYDYSERVQLVLSELKLMRRSEEKSGAAKVRSRTRFLAVQFLHAPKG